MEPPTAWGTLDTEAVSFLLTAWMYKRNHPEQDVYLATDITPIRNGSEAVKLRAIPNIKLIDFIIENSTATAPEIIAKPRFFRLSVQGTFAHSIQGFLFGVLTTIILLLLWMNKNTISQSAPVWGLTLASASLGVFLFWFRSRYRLYYGIVEVLFGLLATTRSANPTSYDSTFVVQIIAGIYIIVRGLDNVEKGIEGLRIELPWRRFFNGSDNR